MYFFYFINFCSFFLPSIILGHYSAILFLTSSPSILEKNYARGLLTVFFSSLYFPSLCLLLLHSEKVISSDLSFSSLILSIPTCVEFVIKRICCVFLTLVIEFLNIRIVEFLWFYSSCWKVLSSIFTSLHMADTVVVQS